MKYLLIKIASNLRGVFKFHKKKIFFFLASLLICLVLLFPYKDLEGFILEKVSQATSRSFQIQFDKVSINFFPSPSLVFTQAKVNSQYLQPLFLKKLKLSPHLTSLLFGKMGLDINVPEIFSGQLQAGLSPTTQLSTQGPQYEFKSQAQNIQIKQFLLFFKNQFSLPDSLSGELNWSQSLALDTSGKAQPQGKFSLRAKNLRVSPTPLNMGGFQYVLPSISLENIQVSGKLSEGTLYINEAKWGSNKEMLNGNLQGRVELDIQRGRIRPGPYSFKLNIEIHNSLKKSLSVIFSFVDIYENIGKKYKFQTSKGIKYSLKAEGRNWRTPPVIRHNNP